MSTPDLSRLRIDRGPGAARRRRLPWGRIVLVMLVLAAGAAFGWKRMNAAPVVEATTIANAWPSQAYTVLNATGYVVPQRKAALSSKAQGRLEWLGVLEGSRIRRGEVVARLESRDVRAQWEQAGAQLAVARANLAQVEAELVDAAANLRRSNELLEKKFISGAQHDGNVARHAKAVAGVGSARAAVSSAQAAQRVAEVAVEQTQIRAPFDAVVLTKNANVGDNITPFSSAVDSKGAVVTIADMSTLEVEADVSEASIAKIRIDQPCEIQLDALPGVRLAGVVSRTVPTVDRAKATVLVKVRFLKPDVRVLPDMSAKVAFLEKPVPEGERKPVPAVQPAAITERDGKAVVFALREGRAVAVPVTRAGKLGELEQLGGIASGERVVLNPPPALRDGMAVEVGKK